MSIKKFNFLPDFTALSEWGHNRQPFFALVDFDGHVAAAPVKSAFSSEKAGFLQGQVDFYGQKLEFRFYVAAQKTTAAQPAMDFHSRPTILKITPPPRDQTISTIRAVQAQLGEGNSYLVNYCSQTIVELGQELSSLCEQSTAPFTIWLEGQFIAFSPEAFITVMENQISTNPMKGTGFDSGLLLADTKEQAEHATVVDLLRNDLGQVARDIRLGDYRYLTAIPQAPSTSSGQAIGRTLYQTSTEIKGTMPGDWRDHIGDWLPRLLPAGSVTGAPKKETVALIRRFETEPRGFFTGVAVLFDGDNLYSCVLIRFLDLAGETLKFRSGAGITIYSDPEQEYEEILNKVYIPV